jgi:hypothetical protein
MTLKSQLKTSVAAPHAPAQSQPTKVASPGFGHNSGATQPIGAAPPKTMTIPEAGWIYYGLSKNGSYDAAARGEIPFIVVGRLKKVSVARMEQIMADGVSPVVSPPPIETSAKPAKALPKPSKHSRSTAMRRRDHQLEPVD